MSNVPSNYSECCVEALPHACGVPIMTESKRTEILGWLHMPDVALYSRAPAQLRGNVGSENKQHNILDYTI